jgi:hypothetical protein
MRAIEYTITFSAAAPDVPENTFGFFQTHRRALELHFESSCTGFRALESLPTYSISDSRLLESLSEDSIFDFRALESLPTYSCTPSRALESLSEDSECHFRALESVPEDSDAFHNPLIFNYKLSINHSILNQNP